MSRLKLIEPGDTIIPKGLVVKHVFHSGEDSSVIIVELLCPNGSLKVTYLYDSDIESIIPKSKEPEIAVGDNVKISSPDFGIDEAHEVRFIDGDDVTVRSNRTGISHVAKKSTMYVVTWNTIPRWC